MDIGVKHVQHLMEFWTSIDEVRIAAVLFFCLCLWCNVIMLLSRSALVVLLILTPVIPICLEVSWWNRRSKRKSIIYYYYYRKIRMSKGRDDLSPLDVYPIWNTHEGGGSIRQTERHDMPPLLVLHLLCVYHFTSILYLCSCYAISSLPWSSTSAPNKEKSLLLSYFDPSPSSNSSNSSTTWI